MSYNLVIIQARMGSTRLPDKVLMDLSGASVLQRVVERVNKSQLIDKIVVATTVNREDDAIADVCTKIGQTFFRGSENDVLDRYYQCAKQYQPKNIIRITADCPLMDSKVIDLVISEHLKNDNDYTSNTIEPTFPDGLDVEIMKFSVLEDAWKDAKLASQREHVTQYIILNEKFKKSNVLCENNLGNLRWTLDTYQDYEFINNVYGRLYKQNCNFDMQAVLELLKQERLLQEINSGQERNEGLVKSLKNDYVIK